MEHTLWNVVFKLLIQSLLFLSSINQYQIFRSILLVWFRRFFALITYKWSVLFLVSSLSLRSFLLIKLPVFLVIFSFNFKEFFTNEKHGFLLGFELGLGGFFHQSYDLKCYTLIRACVKKKTIIMSWSHMIGHIIDLTKSG